MKPRSAPDWMQRLSPAPVSDEDAREATTNLTTFFDILAEWDSKAASATTDVLVTNTEQDEAQRSSAASIEPLGGKEAANNEQHTLVRSRRHTRRRSE